MDFDKVMEKGICFCCVFRFVCSCFLSFSWSLYWSEFGIVCFFCFMCCSFRIFCVILGVCVMFVFVFFSNWCSFWLNNCFFIIMFDFIYWNCIILRLSRVVMIRVVGKRFLKLGLFIMFLKI